LPVLMAPLEALLPGPAGNRLTTRIKATKTPTQDTREVRIFLNSDFLVSRGKSSSRTSPANRRKENPSASITPLRMASTAQTAQNRIDLPEGVFPPVGGGMYGGGALE